MKFFHLKLFSVFAFVAILALAVASVSPALARQGTGTDQTGQGGTYTTQAGDTLGDLMSQAGVDVTGLEQSTDDNLVALIREFFNLNTDLTFVDDSEVVVPEGVQTVGQTPEAGAPLTLGSFNTTYDFTDDQDLREFVEANRNLEVQAGQTVQIPASLPATGTDQTGTGTDQGQTGTDTTGTDQTYVVQSGETLADIAQRNNITIEELLAANPDLVPAGTTINLPGQQIPQTGTGTDQTGTGTTGTDQGQTGTEPDGSQFVLSGEGVPFSERGVTFSEPTRVQSGFASYQVQSGESLSSIARKHGISLARLMEINPNLHMDGILYRGQYIYVPIVEFYHD
jgi:LysM repeat protein